jgi:hypothetical protein
MAKKAKKAKAKTAKATTAKKATAKKAKKSAGAARASRPARRREPPLSVGPIKRAIAKFEKNAASLDPQPKGLAQVLARLREAKKFLPECFGQGGEFEHVPFPPDEL